MRRSPLGFATLLASALFVSVSLGAEPDARALYDDGVKAYREARYEQAIDLFRRAHQLEPHPELAYNLGQAYEKAGDLERAIDSFREYLRLSPKADDRSELEARIANLTKKRAATLATLSVSSKPAGADVRVDGELVGKTPWTGKLAAGAHAVTASRSGHRAASRKVTLQAAGASELAFELEPMAASPVPEPAAEPTEGARIGLPTWIALGVGAGALGAALGFELARRGAEDDVRAAPTQLEHQERFEAAERHRDTARIFAGVGAAAAIAGGVLLFMDLSSGGSRSAPSVGRLRIGVGRTQEFDMGVVTKACF